VRSSRGLLAGGQLLICSRLIMPCLQLIKVPIHQSDDPIMTVPAVVLAQVVIDGRAVIADHLVDGGSILAVLGGQVTACHAVRIMEPVIRRGSEWLERVRIG
jgi:hypothetical protein